MSSFILKTIAIISMFIDHIGYTLFPKVRFLRIIGRIAMPIFAYQIALGFKKTSSKKRYLLRIFLFALYSQLPFLLMRYARRIPALPTPWYLVFQNAIAQSWTLNIGFTFFIALFTLFLLEKSKEQIWCLPLAFYCFLVSAVIDMDYGCFGVAIVLVFYYFMEKKIACTIASALCTLLYALVSQILLQETGLYIELYMLLAFPLIFLHNGQKGKSLKGFFYSFYPIHMLLLFAIKLLILI